MPSRIYLVSSPNAGNRLIRASSAAQAIRHAARATFKASVASQEDLVLHLPAVEVEDAGAEEAEHPGEEVARQSMERAHGVIGA